MVGLTFVVLAVVIFGVVVLALGLVLERLAPVGGWRPTEAVGLRVLPWRTASTQA